MSIKSEKKPLTLRCHPVFNSSKLAEISLPDADVLSAGGCAGLSGELVRLCAALSFAAGDAQLLSDNLSAAGFERLSVALTDDDDPYRVGTAVGVRRDGGGELVAVVLSGTRGAQWYSNFRVGFRQEHRGFAIAAELAEEKLSRYLNANTGYGDIRFLITGYSRGGAAANLLARRVCDRRGADSVRCVTFASPNTTIAYRGACYDNIYNVVRAEDIFTRIPPADWGFTRYGRTVTLSGDIRGSYRRLTGEEYIGLTDPAAAEAVISAMTRLAPSVHAYYKRQYPVGGRMMSLYDYMMSVAGLLSDDADESTGEIMLDSMVSEFGDLSAFLSAGMDISSFLSPAQGIPRCSVGDSHSPAAYLAGILG